MTSEHMDMELAGPRRASKGSMTLSPDILDEIDRGDL
jgi:hypothetical protein